MAGKPAFLMVWMNAPESKEAEWNEWINQVHVPARLKIPEFLFARRYSGIEGDHKYFHLYGLADANVLNSKPYLELREKEHSQDDTSSGFIELTEKIPGICRGVYHQIFPQAKVFKRPEEHFFLTVGIDIPAGRDEEFNAWYNTDHIPSNLAEPGWLAAYRFVKAKEEISPGCRANGAKYVVIWELERAEAFTGPEHQKTLQLNTSAWTIWVRSWYDRRYRSLYRPVL